ncbi:MAG: signal peptidase I [Candidatus Omnitrophota bacterium]|nr:signal peptidase I [Candidatus Omnitrophota bacterium]
MSSRRLTNKKNKLKTIVRDWAESIIFALLLASIVRTFIVQPFKIPTGSMRPTLVEGDVILVNKFIYGAKVPFTKLGLPAVRKPKRGDIIVFFAPQEPNKHFIKRLIGLPGETVQIHKGTIYINNKPLLDPLFNQRYYYNRGDYAREDASITVPQDSYFVLGDNSASSLDSRFWGFVPKSKLVGEAILIYWPPTRIRIIR